MGGDGDGEIKIIRGVPCFEGKQRLVRPYPILTVPDRPGVAEALQYRVGLQYLLLDAGTEGRRRPTTDTTATIVQTTSTMTNRGRRHDVPKAGTDGRPYWGRARMRRSVRRGGGFIDGRAEVAAHPRRLLR